MAAPVNASPRRDVMPETPYVSPIRFSPHEVFIQSGLDNFFSENIVHMEPQRDLACALLRLPKRHIQPQQILLVERMVKVEILRPHNHLNRLVVVVAPFTHAYDVPVRSHEQATVQPNKQVIRKQVRVPSESPDVPI